MSQGNGAVTAGHSGLKLLSSPMCHISVKKKKKYIIWSHTTNWWVLIPISLSLLDLHKLLMRSLWYSMVYIEAQNHSVRGKTKEQKKRMGGSKWVQTCCGIMSVTDDVTVRFAASFNHNSPIRVDFSFRLFPVEWVVWASVLRRDSSLPSQRADWRNALNEPWHKYPPSSSSCQITSS